MGLEAEIWVWRFGKGGAEEEEKMKEEEKILPCSDPLGALRHYKLGNLNRDQKFDQDSDPFLSSKKFLE